jgi:4-hydroxybenzoate polyprenyltransferase
MLTKIKHTLELVRFSHSIFALPYALGVMLVAAHGLPPWQTIIKILIAMVAARTMAMAFNRWLDAEIDAHNPRTAKRHIPAGILSRHYVLGLTITMAIIFVLTCALINPLALALSPIVLVVLLGYSACKRFTHYAHFVLGLALGISPVGAWIAVTGIFSWAPVWVCLAVILWVGGFDIIYAIQDEQFDREARLHSVVTWLGRTPACILAIILLFAMLPPLLIFGTLTQMGIIYYIALAAMIVTNSLIARRASAIYLQGRIPDGPKQGEYLLMLNGLTGLAFLIGCILATY